MNFESDFFTHVTLENQIVHIKMFQVSYHVPTDEQ